MDGGLVGGRREVAADELGLGFMRMLSAKSWSRVFSARELHAVDDRRVGSRRPRVPASNFSSSRPVSPPTLEWK